MPRSIKLIFAVGILLALALLAYAQRPSDYGPDGVPFLKVNINPTGIPAEVNINPGQYIPAVDVARLPEIKFTPTGCSDGRNFKTAIGTSIAGPLLVTFLNTSQQTRVTLVDAQGEQRVNLSPETRVGAAIYLEAGQVLQFDSSIMYSGCRP